MKSIIKEGVLSYMAHNKIKNYKLAEEIGTSAGNLSSFLHTERSIPYEKLERLLVTLNLSLCKAGDKEPLYKPEHIQDAIADAFKASNIKQVELSKLAGVNKCTICSYMSKKRGTCTNSVDRMSTALGMVLKPYKG